jgi:tripartite-type tricarboxylate transporter receptor subunit TctC
LAVHPSLGVNSLAELVALAKQEPGLRYANGAGISALKLPRFRGHPIF